MDSLAWLLSALELLIVNVWELGGPEPEPLAHYVGPPGPSSNMFTDRYKYINQGMNMT